MWVNAILFKLHESSELEGEHKLKVWVINVEKLLDYARTHFQLGFIIKGSIIKYFVFINVTVKFHVSQLFFDKEDDLRGELVVT